MEKHLDWAQPYKNRNLRIRRRKIAPKYTLGKYDWRLTSKDFATFDVWLTRWMNYKGLDKKLGIDFIEAKGQVPDHLYKKAEKLMMEVADKEYSEYNLTTSKFTAVLWGKHAKWSKTAKESYIRTVANHTECNIEGFP